jgi:hypothetical protein
LKAPPTLNTLLKTYYWGVRKMLRPRKLDVWFNTLDIWLNRSRGTSAQPRVTKLEEDVPPKRRRRSKKSAETHQYAEDDSWDGSIDNAEKALENHVSRYGELF